MAEKDRRSIKERPVPFMQEIELHVRLWESDTQFRFLHSTVKDAVRYLKDLLQTAKTLQEVEEIAYTTSKDILSSETNKYIAIFKAKYLEITDIEFTEKINPTTYSILRLTVEKVLQSGSSVSEYLSWFFDELLPGSKGLFPSLGLSVSNNIFSQFAYDKKDELRARRRELIEKQDRLETMKLATEAFKETHDEELAQQIVKFKAGRMSAKKLRTFVAGIAQKFQLKGIISKLQAIDSPPKESK